jgi:hypothetical protein
MSICEKRLLRKNHRIWIPKRVLQFPLPFFLFLFALSPLFGKSTLSVVYLSYQHDPAHTILIHWHAARKQAPKVAYRLKGDAAWMVQEGIAVQLSESKVCVHTVELMDLASDVEYEFCIQKESFRFRTLPETLSRPVHFIIGGDALFDRKVFQKMNVQIAAQNPDFIVVGGDIAYTCGVPRWMQNLQSTTRRWHIFFTEWKKQMVTADGRLIPIVPVVGNHDVRLTAQGAYFYTLFSLPESIAFRVLDIGDYLSLFLLDTGHSCTIQGMQTNWLKMQLSQRENRPYKMAAYHVSAYPSVYPFEARTSRAAREAWSPVFERYRVPLVFEHHNHAYKRTFPLKSGRIDPDGVVYIGDGSWGVHARATKPHWYLARGEKANAVCLVTLARAKADVKALQINGEAIDAISLLPMQNGKKVHLIE